MNTIYLADCEVVLDNMESESVNLVFTDPPFNTKKKRVHGSYEYQDNFNDFKNFIYPKMSEFKRILTSNGSLLLHLDTREVHYCKVWLDQIFGRECFMNEIIWSFDYGGRAKKYWPRKHNNILWYVKDPKNYTYNYDEIERRPYKAPGLAGPEKAAKGKTLTDVIWCTVAPTNGPERTGYPTQKPLKLVDQLVRVHSNPGDTILDPFGGSGTTGEASARNNRPFVLVDSNEDAVAIMRDRLSFINPPVVTKH